MQSHITHVISTPNVDYDDVIITYFDTVESTGSYLIAETYVDMIAQTAINGYIPLPKSFKTSVARDRVVGVLNQINQSAINDEGNAIYEGEANRIRINNPSNLSHLEKCAILATHTANVCFNSFAAEVEYHAEMAIEAYNILSAGIDIFVQNVYNQALRAGMGIAEADDSKESEQMPYYSPASPRWIAQIDAHGEQ
jgi:hypothetical protein